MASRCPRPLSRPHSSHPPYCSRKSKKHPERPASSSGGPQPLPAPFESLCRPHPLPKGPAVGDRRSGPGGLRAVHPKFALWARDGPRLPGALLRPGPPRTHQEVFGVGGWPVPPPSPSRSPPPGNLGRRCLDGPACAGWSWAGAGHCTRGRPPHGHVRRVSRATHTRPGGRPARPGCFPTGDCTCQMRNGGGQRTRRQVAAGQGLGGGSRSGVHARPPRQAAREPAGRREGSRSGRVRPRRLEEHLCPQLDLAVLPWGSWARQWWPWLTSGEEGQSPACHGGRRAAPEKEPSLTARKAAAVPGAGPARRWTWWLWPPPPGPRLLHR